MPFKTAVIFGATGLIGSHVLNQLLHDDRYSKIILFSRKSIHTGSNKVVEIITGFEDKELLENHLQGDEIYCCLGTTLAKAGSKKAFRKVDYDLPVMIGAAAKKKGISSLLIVSSLGADARSNNFYLRTKGEMEQTLKSFEVPGLHFFRPSMLLGSRKEPRPGETIGKMLMQLFSFVFIGGLRKYKAIPAQTVAKAMINVANSKHAEEIYESEEIALVGQ